MHLFGETEVLVHANIIMIKPYQTETVAIQEKTQLCRIILLHVWFHNKINLKGVPGYS